MKNKLNLNKIVNQVKDLHRIAKENSWVPYYDAQLDEFYFSPKVIDKKYTMQAIGDEFLVYVDQNSNLGGVYINYFNNNLSSHDPKFKPFKRIFAKHQKINSENKTLLLNTIEAALLETIATPKFNLA
ncbi:MAG TPA: hypothetical protein VG917_03165 [Patescibacteria group bacterium]|nr:hypothetical protein [Patescibacteria group bacterium]